MSFGKLVSASGTNNVVNARVRLPAWGIWAALVTLDRGDSTLAGPVTLTLGSLVLRGTIRRGGPFVGRGQYRIFGGADGWGKTIPSTSYRAPQTPLSVLAKDAAALVGETIVMDSGGEQIVGPYSRFLGPASDVLSIYSDKRWWVETDGTTHVGDRTPLPAPSVQILDFDPELGIATFSDDTAIVLPGQLLPAGATVGTVSSVFVDLEGGTLRTEAYLQ